MRVPSFAILQTRVSTSELCKPCGGECCITYAGIAWPEQFGAPDVVALEQRLTAAFVSRNWAVDCWDGFRQGEPGWYVRPAHTNGKDVIDRSWGGTCVFWKDGCTLTADARPIGCSLLIATPKGVKGKRSCTYRGTGIAGPSKTGREIAAAAWWKYRDVLLRSVAKAREGLA